MLIPSVLLMSVCFLAQTAWHWDPHYPISTPQHRWNPNVLLIIVLLTLLIGLRTDYNDTTAYIAGFRDAPPLSDLLSSTANLSPLKNPLFELYTSLFRTLTENYHLYFMASGLFISGSMVSLFRRLSEDEPASFSLNLFTYLTLGTYFFSLAAMKQTIAMAFLALAIPPLLEKKYVRFFVLVLIAGLFHTYAFLVVILPFLTGRPWRGITFIIVFGTFAVMATFESTISSFLVYADAIGKGISSDEVFSGAGMSLLRVGVYGVVPIISFLFRPILEPQMSRRQYLMLHMSILSFMFMLLAAINGANMFGRMARYFELGTVYMFPWVIRHLFNHRSVPVVTSIYAAAFLFFLAYGFWDFGQVYHSISLFQFISELVPI